MGTNLLLAINIEKPLCQITITMKIIFESHAVMLYMFVLLLSAISS